MARVVAVAGVWSYVTLKALGVLVAFVLVAVLVVAFLIRDPREARIAAAAAAIEQSLAIQAILGSTQRCPTELGGWEPEPEDGMSVLVTHAGNADREYKLSLRCDEDRQDFGVTVHYSFDDHVYVRGNFDGPLELVYGHFTDTKRSVVPSSPDIAQLAELLAYGG